MAGYMWLQTLDLKQWFLNPKKWDWRCVKGTYLPMWSDLTNAFGVIKELFRCSLDYEKNGVTNVNVTNMIYLAQSFTNIVVTVKITPNLWGVTRLAPIMPLIICWIFQFNLSLWVH